MTFKAGDVVRTLGFIESIIGGKSVIDAMPGEIGEVIESNREGWYTVRFATIVSDCRQDEIVMANGLN